MSEEASSQIRSRSRQYKYAAPIVVEFNGIPGVPLFERADPNPDLFYQGEDIVYDMILVHNYEPVSTEEYDVFASIKTSPRAKAAIWQGSLDNGVYPVPNTAGHYELWVPSSVTDTLLAGTYYLDVLIQERIGEGKGKFDRKFVVLQHMFNLEYSNFSGAPENANASSSRERINLERTWPNMPNTVGKPPIAPDEVFYSTE